MTEQDLIADALATASNALDDWLRTYADDLFEPHHVEESRRRIGKYGTLSYIGMAQEKIRAALTTLEASRIPEGMVMVPRSAEPDEVEYLAEKRAVADKVRAALSASPQPKEG